MYLCKITLLLLFILSITVGCNSANDFTVEGKLNVVTSFYPLYDFVKKIGGVHVNVINLVPAGVEPHEWSPKPRDMSNITNANVFIYNGAGLEGWVDDFLDSLRKDNPLVIVDATHDVDLIEIGDHGDVDPHAWISPLQAKVMAATIKDHLIEADPANKGDYETNYNLLADRLQALHEQLTQIISQAPKHEIVVSHEAFGYIARDYGITQVGVMGLTPDSEPTIQRMNEITKFAKEHQIKYILFEKLVSPKLAETLAKSLQIETLVLNPIEGLTEEQEREKEDYFTIMADNMTVIEKALQ